MKLARKLRIGSEKKLHALKEAEELYIKLYSSHDIETEDPRMETMNIEVPCVNTSEIKKALK